MRSVVLDGFAVNPGDLSWDFLKKSGEAVIFDKTPESEVASRCKGADAVFTNRCRITAAVLDACPEIRFVSALGTGYDMIDVKACRQRGVVVCNVPAYSTASVAQLAFTLLLSLTTDLPGLRGIVSDGKWTGLPGFQYQKIKYTELAGLTLGLIGFGNIGKAMAGIAQAFGMNVIATTRSRVSGSESGVRFMPLYDMLPLCDAVSLHCPLTSETKELVNESFIAAMKDGAYIVNTSRGAVIDEAAAAAALKSGKLAGLAADVLSKEPPEPSNPLLSAPNTVITPHAAWTTLAARKRLMAVLDANLSQFVATGKGVNEVF